MMCKGGGKARKPYPFEVVTGGKIVRHHPPDAVQSKSVEQVEQIVREIASVYACDNSQKPLDCSAGDRPQVILSDTTAILMAEAFIDMANARVLYVDNLEASEAMTRAFGEIELLQKLIENRDGVVA